MSIWATFGFGYKSGFTNNEAAIQRMWIGLDWIGLDWIGLDWIGLDIHKALGIPVLLGLKLYQSHGILLRNLVSSTLIIHHVNHTNHILGAYRT
jgi:hypothetical protein